MDKNNILISCCVTSYQHLEGIFKSIDSILMQDYPEIEIAVFDDGTDSFPVNDIKNYIDANKKVNIKNVIVHTNKKNVGTVKNLNGMVNCLSGEYIIELGADDELFESSTCTKIVNKFIENNANILTSYRISKVNGVLGDIIPSHKNAMLIEKYSPEEQYKWIAMGAPLAGAGTFYRRSFLRKIGGFDEDYHLQEDGPMFLHATRVGEKIHFLQEITFVYAQGQGVSSGKKNNPILMDDVKRMFEKEIVPYIGRFSFSQKRRIYYGYERAVVDQTEKVFL